MHLICSFHPAPLSSQSHRLLPQAEICKWSSDRIQKIISSQFDDQQIRKADTLSCSWLALCFCSYVYYGSTNLCLDQVVSLSKPGGPHVRCCANIVVVSIPAILQQSLDACVYSNDFFILPCKFCYPIVNWPTCVSSLCLLTLASGYQLRKMIAFVTGLIPFPRDLSQLYPLQSQEGRYRQVPWKNISDAT